MDETQKDSNLGRVACYLKSLQAREDSTSITIAQDHLHSTGRGTSGTDAHFI